MGRRSILLILGLLDPLGAQDVKVGGLITLWYHKALDAELRTWDLLGSRLQEPGTPYTSHHSGLREHGWVLRRSELYFSGRLNPTLSWNIAMDPNFGGNIVSDAAVMWTPAEGVSLRIGQFKPPQGFEGSVVPATQLFFYDRSMVARQFSDRWDRGAALTLARPYKGWQARFTLAVFNGSGRAGDQNAQKDGTFRFEVEHPWGLRAALFGLQGRSDARGDAVVYPLPGSGPPTASDVRASGDATSTFGGYVVAEQPTWHLSLEALGGRIGRRFPTLGPAPVMPALRQHLDQRFLGWVATAVRRHRKDTWGLRWERMDYNTGRDAHGAPSGPAPVYTELVAGWSRALSTEAAWRSVCFKLDAIRRTGPLLWAKDAAPRTGNSLVAVLQVAF